MSNVTKAIIESFKPKSCKKCIAKNIGLQSTNGFRSFDKGKRKSFKTIGL